jgi:hypothetical protein
MKNIGQFTVALVSLILCLSMLFFPICSAYALEIADESVAPEVLSEEGTTEAEVQTTESATAPDTDVASTSSETENSFETGETSSESTAAATQPTASDEAQTVEEGVEPTAAKELPPASSQAAEEKVVLPVASEPFVMPAKAAPPNPESDFHFDKTTGTILEHIGTGRNVTIPSTIQGVPVRRIGAWAFSHDQLLGDSSQRQQSHIRRV